MSATVGQHTDGYTLDTIYNEVADHLPDWEAHPADPGSDVLTGPTLLLRSLDLPGLVRLTPNSRDPWRRTSITARWIGPHGASHAIHAAISGGPEHLASHLRRRLLNAIPALAGEQEHRHRYEEAQRARVRHVADCLTTGLTRMRAAKVDDRRFVADASARFGDGGGLIGIEARARVDFDEPVPSTGSTHGIRVSMRLDSLTVEQAARIHAALTNMTAETRGEKA